MYLAHVTLHCNSVTENNHFVETIGLGELFDEGKQSNKE